MKLRQVCRIRIFLPLFRLDYALNLSAPSIADVDNGAVGNMLPREDKELLSVSGVSIERQVDCICTRLFSLLRKSCAFFVDPSRFSVLLLCIHPWYYQPWSPPLIC